MRFFYFIASLVASSPLTITAFTSVQRRSRISSTTSSSSSLASTQESSQSQTVDNALLQLATGDSTETKLTPEQVVRYNVAIESLPPAPSSLDVNGGWRLLATISPEAMDGDNVDFFDAKSWQNYIGGTGPSPFQSLITGSSRVSGLTQWLSPFNFDNVVEFTVGPISGKLVLKADQEDFEGNKRIFRFRRGFFILKTLWDSSVTIPYPVPFNLLGDRAVGWLETTHYDENSGFRAAIGNKGTKFIFQKEEDATIPEDIVVASDLTSTRMEHETDEEERINNQGLSKRAVLLCPQQFAGKPGDYTVLTRRLRELGHPVYLARLTTLDWWKITKFAFSGDYIKSELKPKQALRFYMDSVNDAVARMPHDQEFTILSHSIGGWISRAWLGEIASESVRKRCKKYVSLGTPQIAPPVFDNTRGLLNYVNDHWPGAYWEDVEYTCVASKGVTGALSLDLDSLLGFSSYYALIGEGGVEGDGITPVKGALLDGANSIVLDDVYHADVLSYPIGSRNTRLVGCRWYADKLDEWAQAL